MKNLGLLSITFVSLLLFNACIKEECPIQKEKEVVQASFILTDLTRSISKAENDETSGTDEENDIQVLEFYIFNQDGSRDPHEGGYKKITEMRTDKKYSIAMMEGEKIVLVAANMELGPIAGIGLKEVRKKIPTHTLSDKNSRDIPTTGIPMSGEKQNILVEKGQVTEVKIEVSRLYSKLTPLKASDVKVKVEKEEVKDLFTEEISGNLSFNLQGYFVINGLTKSYAFFNYNEANDEAESWDHTSCWTLGGDLNNYFTTPKEADNAPVYSGGKGDDKWITDKNVFIYENSPKPKPELNIKGFDRKTVYALILKGIFKDQSGKESSSRYWRMYIGSDDHYKILRNAQYTVTLKNVTTTGFSSEDEAVTDGGDGYIPGEGKAAIEAEIAVKKWRNFSFEEDI